MLMVQNKPQSVNRSWDPKEKPQDQREDDVNADISTLVQPNAQRLKLKTVFIHEQANVIKTKSSIFDASPAN